MVDTQEKLALLLPTLHQAVWVAVDTEADSLHAYPEKVCLIQVSVAKGDYLIDPLADLNLDPFLEALTGHELIMHGADYDLRLLRKHHEFVPKAIFDTMLAARLLGLRQFSLGNLVEKYLGVKLEKGPQKANWAVRPLTRRMETYAQNDTRHLKTLADQMRDELKAKGRLDWHQEACAQLIADSARPRSVDRELVWRVKGSHLLGRRGLAVLRELWHWRESEAVAANKPPFFVISHDLLVEFSAAAVTGKPVEAILPRHLSPRRRSAILKTVATALACPAEKHPLILRKSGRRPTEAERRRFQELQNRRDARAAELDIDPTVIASRVMLSDLAHNWEKYARDLMPWQRNLLSD